MRKEQKKELDIIFEKKITSVKFEPIVIIKDKYNKLSGLQKINLLNELSSWIHEEFEKILNSKT